MTTDLSRRSAIATLGIGAAAMTINNEASAQTPAAAPAPVPAFAGNHQVRPLKFDPAKLVGLSERLIRSHHENNYTGSVRALNMIETRLFAALADPDLPPAVYGGLKREELHRTRSEENTSDLQSPMPTSYAVLGLKKTAIKRAHHSNPH